MVESVRQRLPGRRMTITTTVQWRAASWLVAAGFDPDGRVREVFIDPDAESHGAAKVGSDMRAMLEDACIVISRCLQYGDRAEDLAKTLSREGSDAGENASQLGVLAARLASLEQEAGRGVRDAYAALQKQEGLSI